MTNRDRPTLAQRYQWLLFDADGTLFDFDAAESVALRQAFLLGGLRFEESFLKTYRHINRELWSLVEQGQLAPGVLKLLRFERLFEAIGNLPLPPHFGDNYLRCLAQCSGLLDGAERVLRDLSERFRIAILTNGLQAVQRPRFDASAIRNSVDELVISEEVGHAKPSRAFFDAAFARLGHPNPREVLLIGDSWSSDIVGGAGYGIDTCWFNPGRKARPMSPAITCEVATLEELRNWLEPSL